MDEAGDGATEETMGDEVGLWVFILGAAVLGLLELTASEIVAPGDSARFLQILGIVVTGLGVAVLRRPREETVLPRRVLGVVVAGLLVSTVGVALGLAG